MTSLSTMPTFARAPRADEARFRALFDGHVGLVWRAVRRLGVPEDRVDDVVQRVFVVAARRLGEIEEGRGAAFLLAVAARTAGEMRRRDPRRREIPDDDAVAAAVASERLPEAIVAEREALDIALSIFEAMPDELREVFARVELEGRTIAEAAAALAVPVGTAASRLRRAREHLAKQAARVRAGNAAPSRVRRRALAAGLAALAVGATPKAAHAAPLFASVAAVGAAAAIALVVVLPRAPAMTNDSPATTVRNEHETTTRRVSVMASIEGTAPTPVPTLDLTNVVPPPAQPRTQDRLSEEVVVLERARKALRAGDVGSAERALASYSTQFGAGALADEAAALAIDVAAARGDRAQTRALAERFLRERPTSPHATHVRAMLSEEPR